MIDFLLAQSPTSARDGPISNPDSSKGHNSLINTSGSGGSHVLISSNLAPGSHGEVPNIVPGSLMNTGSGQLLNLNSSG
jgi:hypothetical protein